VPNSGIDLSNIDHSVRPQDDLYQHINAPDQAAALVERMRELFQSEPTIVSEIGPVLAAHTGPGLLGTGGLPQHFVR
jgi:fatty acid-binding protein DegV